MPLLGPRMELAIRAARRAGQLTLTHYGSVQVERKADDSPVTVADREAEQLLRREIAEHFPEDGIVGEEFGEQAGSSGFRWILDPIDGTKSFISGVPLYGTMVGLELQHEAVGGVVFIQGLDEMIHAARGKGAWFERGGADPVPARVSQKSLDQGLFVTSQVDTFAGRDAMAAFQALQDSAYITRTWGDCYGYLLVATGRAEVMVDPEMNVWDAAALQPILEEAGGRFTDWQGTPTIHSGDGVGCNQVCYAAVRAITSRYPRPS